MQEQDRYKTILVIVTGLLVLSQIFDVGAFNIAALVVGLLAILITPAAKFIEWLWFRIAIGLGWVNSRILLSIIFFFFLMPMAWFSRRFSKDSLNLKRKNAASLFNTRNHKYRKEDLENIW
ncbi:SxtJ family membrane protein [Chryseosolibacter indicus]|uniref:SxtJ family membrane protein n=1 Tax=Chryseosolibacter indicus TaxID=2782351 RepID=UPI0020B426E5